jgi:hypothetical protein
MDYKVKIVFKQKEISDKEKADRLKQFQQAFISAAVNYYSDKLKQKNTQYQ